MDTEIEFESFRTGDTIVGRLLPGTDLVAGLRAACDKHGAKYAVITSLIGSLRETDFVVIEPEPASWSGIRYGASRHVAGGVEIIGASGMLGQWEDGRPSAHIHFTVIDTRGVISAGHVSDSGNPCLITVEFALKVVEHGSITRRRDPKLGFPVFVFEG